MTYLSSTNSSNIPPASALLIPTTNLHYLLSHFSGHFY
nr:MAG TPA: hypothetical protein [Caudoviricetes sp.]